MDTPACKRKAPGTEVDAESLMIIWSQSPLVITSPGGNVSTKGRTVRTDSSSTRTDNEKAKSLQVYISDNENFESRMTSVSVPSGGMPPPLLRSSLPLQITPLKASNRQENAFFPFSPTTDYEKLPLSTTSKSHRSKQQRAPICSRPPMSGKKLKNKMLAQLKAIEIQELEASRQAHAKREMFMQQQEKLYLDWLNFVLKQPMKKDGNVALESKEELESSDCGSVTSSADSTLTNGSEMVARRESFMSSYVPKVGKGTRVSKSSTNRRENLPASETGDGLQVLCTLTVLRQKLNAHFDPSAQEEIISIMTQVAKRIDDGRLRMKEGCAVLADVGLRKKAVEVLMSYSASWLKTGLDIVLGLSSFCNENCGEQTQDAEDTILEITWEKHFFTHVGVAKEYATNKSVEGLYRQGYHEALGRVILKRLLLLVLVLDKLKSISGLQNGHGVDGLDGGSPLLFRRNSKVKSSRQALGEILINAMHGEGDLMAHLGTLGYRLYHVQPLLAEYNFETTSLIKDLQDGVRLCRLAQLMTNDTSLLMRIHLPSNGRKRQKRNCEVALATFAHAGVSLIDEQGFIITAEDIVDGDRDKALFLLWNIISHLQIPQLLNRETLVQEIFRIESTKGYLEDPDENPTLHITNLLLRWTKAICETYGFPVENFRTSFLDGQALCYLVNFYLPVLLHQNAIMTGLDPKVHPMDIQHPSFEGPNLIAEHNFGLVHEVSKKLGFMPEVLKYYHIVDGDPRWVERNIIFFVCLLCSKFVGTDLQDLQHELVNSANATDVLKAETDSQMKMEDSAIRIQAQYRSWVQRLIYRKVIVSAQNIQSTWKGHFVRKHYSKQKLAARIIQQQWRKLLLAREEKKRIRTALRRVKAITAIQSAYRAHAQRSNYRRMIDCAVKIQATWRGYVTWRKYILQKALVEKVQHKWRKILQNRKHCQLHYAATVIQAHYRSWAQMREYKERICDVRRIQSVWRRYLALRTYIRERASVVRIQKQWRRCLARREHRKNLASKIQAFWRGHLVRKSTRAHIRAVIAVQSCYRRYVLRKSFISYKRKVIMVQALFRRRCLQRRFVQYRNAACHIQSFFRGWLAWKKAKKLLIRSNSAKKIQTSWKKSVYTKKTMSALVIQTAYRGWRERRAYALLLEKVIFLQAFYRGTHARRQRASFSMGKPENIMELQSTYGGDILFNQRKNQAMGEMHLDDIRRQRASFSMGKPENIMELQSTYGGDILFNQRKNQAMGEMHLDDIRRHPLYLHSATLIQAYWRGYTLRKQNSLSMAHEDQYQRQNLAHLHSLKERKSALFIQKWWRRLLRNRIEAAAVAIQCSYRGWISRKLFKQKKRSADLLKAYWRGYTARKEQSEQLLELRLRIQNTAATVDCNMTLGNRLNEALAVLLSYKTVSGILHICATIDLATQHSKCCCERIADGGAIIKLVQLIQTTNRSTPHEQVLKHALSILGNLARFPALARQILETPSSLDVVAEQLQMSRNKEEIFFKAMQVLKLVCKVTREDVAGTAPLVLRRLQHIRQLLERKVDVERRNVERLPPAVNVVRLAAEKKLAEAKMQLQSTLSLLKVLTGEPQTQDNRRSSTVFGAKNRRESSSGMQRVKNATTTSSTTIRKLAARTPLRDCTNG